MLPFETGTGFPDNVDRIGAYYFFGKTSITSLLTPRTRYLLAHILNEFWIMWQHLKPKVPPYTDQFNSIVQTIPSIDGKSVPT